MRGKKMDYQEEAKLTADYLYESSLRIFWENVAMMDRKELIQLIKTMRKEIDENKKD